MTSPSRRTLARWLLALACVGMCPGLGQRASAEEAPTRAPFDQALHHAETYYWFGMAERGNMAAYRKGLSHLATAQALLDASAWKPDRRSVGQARIDALRADLDEQAEIGHDTLYGVFPLFRFFTPTLFADQTNLSTFELLDEPTVMVTTGSAKKLAWIALGSWTPKAQLDAVFVSTPRDEALENEALYVFNAVPKFFVHNQREAIEALTPDQRRLFFAGELTSGIRDALLGAFDVPELLVVLIRGVDVVDGDHFAILDGRLVDWDDPMPRHRFQVMGFSRDRRMWFGPLILVTILLLVFAYLAFAGIVRLKRRAGVRVSPVTYALVPALAFVVGRATPWAIGPALRRFAPDPENLAIISFWAPITAGLVIVTLPMVVYWVLGSRLSRIFPALTFEGRGAATCVAIGAGVVAYLAVPAFLYLESGAFVALGLLTVATTLVSYLCGRALDPAERLHGGFAVLAGLLAMAVVATFLTGSLPWLVGSTLVTGSVFAAVQATTRRQVTEQGGETSSGATGARAGAPSRALLSDPASSTVEPAFWATRTFEQGWDRLQPFRAGQAQRLGLVGGPGSGLSRNLSQLVERLDATLTEQGRAPLVLTGRGRQRGGRAVPYGPFREALVSYFEVDLLVAREADGERMDRSIGGLLESLVPFGSLLFPDTSGVASESSQENLYASILWVLRRLARKQPVMLVLDNLQAFDAASSGLLAYLVRHFPSGKDEPLLLLVASHDVAVLTQAGFRGDGEDILELGYPAASEQLAILEHGVGLEPATARQILERVGVASEATQGMTWLLRVVGELARASAFEVAPGGLVLRDGQLPDDVALPQEMGEVVAMHLERSPAYRHTLAAAACGVLGREFDVELLCRVLDVGRLELLERLDEIERETGIVRDVGERDDVYAFASYFMLDAVRSRLRVRDAGPDDAEVPQLIREFHARLAQALEQDLDRNPGGLYRVADHYYAAGARHAASAMQYGLLAARAHAAIADFDGCEQDLGRADECARYAGREEDVEEVRRAIQAQRAQMVGSGDEVLGAAREGTAYLTQHPDAGVEYRLAVGHLAYEAGKRRGDTSLLAQAADIGRDLVDRAATPLEEAAGRHLVGVSLPREEQEERVQELQRALELLEGAADLGPDATRLLGRVLGSLAGERMRGTARDGAHAKELLERRLALIETSGVGDLRGLAMTHGALGRLALFVEPRDLALAKEHLGRDLEISEAIGDRAGQVQMHSLLGACGLESGDLDLARRHYQTSWELGDTLRAHLFAGAGLLRVHAAAGDAQALASTAGMLADVLPSASEDVAKEAVGALSQALRVVEESLPAAELAGLAAWLAEHG